MSTSRFAGVRSLFGGTAHPVPPEDASANSEQKPAGAPAGPTQAQVETVLSDAVSAESKRWSTVMLSDAGAANPKAAARLLTMAGGAASADEVIASLAEMPAPAAAAPAAPAVQEDPNSPAALAAARETLNNDAGAQVNTGPASGSRASRTGEGEDSANAQATADVKAKREQRKKDAQERAAKTGARVGNQSA